MHKANIHLLTFLSSALLLGTLAAQTTTHVAPTGYDKLPGNGGNAIPLWSGSAVYMQVHDASDLATVFPAAVAILPVAQDKPLRREQAHREKSASA